MSVEIGKLELKAIIRRRKKIFLISSMLIFFVCTVVALVLPSIYESEVMIIVENQEIMQQEFNEICELCTDHKAEVYVGGRGFDFVDFNHVR